jgi:hypothetical protein
MLTRRHLLLLAPLGAVAACADDPAVGTPSLTSSVTTTTATPSTPTASSSATTPVTPTPPPTTKATAARPAATLEVLRDELSALSRRYGVDLGVAATETRSKRSFTWGADRTIETASIAKADILATLLLQLQDRRAHISSRQLAVATHKIRRSDHESASTLFREIALDDGMDRANRRFGMKATQAFDYSWGLTRTTARDQLRFVSALDTAGTKSSPLTAGSAKVLLDLMEDVVPEQKWGISAAAHRGDRVCLKNGWLKRSKIGQRWIINSIGRISSPTVDLRLAILSQKWTSQGQGIEIIEQAAALTRKHLAV